jgi:hypothetical protein
MRPAHRSDLVLLLVLACSLTVAGGCVVIVPTVPENIPGYGTHYSWVDEDGIPIEAAGLMLMHSIYEAGPYYVRCWKVSGSCVDVPKASGVRFFGSPWGPMIGPPLGYFGMFMNPKFTDITPLAPGYVPAGWPTYDRGDRIVNSRNVESLRIQLMPADPALEHEYLTGVLRVLDARGEGDDEAAREEARQYATERLNALEPQSAEP